MEETLSYITVCPPYRVRELSLQELCDLPKFMISKRKSWCMSQGLSLQLPPWARAVLLRQGEENGRENMKNLKWATCCRKELGGFSKVKHTIIIWAYNSTLWYIPKGTENRYSNKYLYINFLWDTIHNSQKVESIKQIWYIHTTKYNSTIKRVKYWYMLQHARTLETLY